MIDLTEERPGDWWEVEALLDTCFAPGRTALSSYRLRDGVEPVSGLSFVARDGEGILAGAIRNALYAAARAGWARVLLVGDAPYYKRFGFSRLPDVVMPPPTNPDRVLGQDLIHGAWRGVSGPVTRWEGPVGPGY